MAQFAFNATDFDPSTGAGSVWESGIYGVQITNSEFKETKAKTGWMLVLTMTATDPEMRGKTIAARLNVNNPNATAVEIAMRELSAICHVVGVLNMQDTQQLHGRPFKINVEKVPRSDDPTKEGNNIIGYLDINGNPPGKGGAGAPAAPAAPTAPAQPAAPAPAAQPAAPAPAPAAAAPAAGQPAAPWAGGAPAPAPAPAAAAPAPAPAAAAPAPTGDAGANVPPWLQNRG